MKKSYTSVIAGIAVVASLTGGSAVLTSCSNKKEEPKQVEVTATTPAVEPTATIEPTASPSEPTIEPTVSPAEATSEPTQAPTATEQATPSPQATNEATNAPEPTTQADYSKLSDAELVSMVGTKITAKYSGKLTNAQTIKSMDEVERNVYTIYVFSNDVKKGLYNYLKGKNNVTADGLSDALQVIGADSSQELYDDFIDSMRIDVSNSKKLASIKKDEYQFDVFDEEYAEYSKNENLEELLAAYIRTNIQSLNLN